MAEEKEKLEEAQRIIPADKQEQYLRALESEDVPVGIVILEGEKRLITFVNPALSKLWGKTKEQVLHRPLFEAFPELEEQVFKELLHGVYTTGIPYFGTEVPAVFIIDGKKETVYFNFVYSPIHDEKGMITGIFVTAIDVTAQVQAKQQVVEEQKRLYDFLQASPAAMAVLRGKDLVYELANESYQKIVGKTQEQLLGQPGRKAIPELTTQGVWDIFDTVNNTGTPFYGNEFAAQLDRLGGGRLDQGYFNFVAQPIKNEKGEVERIFIYAYEVTEQVKARQRVEESEERFRALVNATSDVIYRMSPDWSEMRQLDGRNFLADTGKPDRHWMQKYIHPNDQERVMKAINEAIRTKSVFQLEHQVNRLDDSPGWVFSRAVPILDKNAAIIEWFGAASDITELKQAEEALHKVTAQQEETLALLESLLKNAPIGFAFFDQSHRYIRINETLATINGIAAKDHIGKSIEELLPENAKTVVPVLERVMKTKEAVVDLEVTGETPKEPGKTRYWLTGFYPVFIGKSRNVDVVGAVVIEITAMKKLEQQKDEFLAVASHELKTPVTSIKAYNQVLQKLFKKKGDRHSVELLTKMDGQINKLISLINDLLDISKIQAGKLQLRLNNFDFDELVTELVDEVQRMATHHTIRIEQRESKLIYGDRDRIGQVIMNLLTNAMKYSPYADSVVVKTRADQETITFCVQDFGLGIPKEKQAKVFEQFYRVERREVNIYPGLGLGLYISSEIIQRHGGTIWVEGAEGKGSTFCFTIPTQEHTLQQPGEGFSEEAIPYGEEDRNCGR